MLVTSAAGGLAWAHGPQRYPMTPDEAAVLLGVPVSAAPDEVARAFRSRARAVHPDTTGGLGDEFIALSQARDALLAHRVAPAAVQREPPFSLRLFLTWIGLLVLAALLGATGEASPLAPAEPVVRSVVLVVAFALYARTGRRGYLVLALLALTATAVVAVVFTTLGSLLGLLIGVPAVYGLVIMGQREARRRE